MKRIVATIFHAPLGTANPERLVEAGRLASAEDLIDVLLPRVEEVVVVAGGDRERLGSLDVDVVRPDPKRPFHFGATLKQLVRERQPDTLLYFGSGSGGLLREASLDVLFEFAWREEPGALFNNFYSCDFAVFAPACSLLEIPLPENDNALGFALSDAGVQCFSLPRSLETEFDIDTPTDLLLLRASDRGGPAMRRYLAEASLRHPTFAAICDRLVDRSSLVHLHGRINPTTWGTFERRVACRTSGTVEGRGLRAHGDVRSYILQRVLREDGPVTFFDRLAEVADATILDTRPLLAVDGRLPPASDRFASDLFLVDGIEDLNWRAFTQAAASASIPVLLGGHSLVSGGLYLLAEACWKGRDLVRRLHPEPFTGRKQRT